MAGGLSPPARETGENGKVKTLGRFTRLVLGRRGLNKGVKNVAIKTMYDKNVAPAKSKGVRHPDAYMTRTFGTPAKAFAEGKYGNLYKLNINPAGIKQKLDALRHTLKHHVGTDRVPVSGTFAVKIALQPSDQDWTAWVRDNVYEAQAHKQLATRCTRLSCAARPACTPSPKLYFAGVDVAARVFVTVMELVNGVTLYEYLRGKRTLTPSTYLNIEKAIVSMWLNGIVHGDLHDDNIMVSRNGSRVWVIDFGFAVVLPDNRLQALKRVMDDVPNVSNSLANSVWYAKNALQGYVNSVLHHKRRLDWYNADGKLLKGMYLKVPSGERGKIGKMRRQLWGCKPRPGIVARCIGKIVKKKGKERCVQNKEQANPNPRRLSFHQRKNLRRLVSPGVQPRNKEAARQRLVAHRIIF